MWQDIKRKEMLVFENVDVDYPQLCSLLQSDSMHLELEARAILNWHSIVCKERQP